MIIKESKVAVIDNSGAKRAKCIGILGQLKIGFPGSILITTIKKAIPKRFKKKKKVIKRGEIHKLLLCSTRKGLRRLTGHFLRAFRNSAVVLRKENFSLPFANRIKRLVFLEVRTRSTKISMMSHNAF